MSGIKTSLSATSRDAIWGACVSALSAIPRLLRTLLQLMQVKDLKDAELPRLGHTLSILLQHTPLHSQLMASSALLQDIIQHLTVTPRQALTWLWPIGPPLAWLLCVFQRCYRGATRQQWVTDLLYYYSVTVAHGSSSRQGNLGLWVMRRSPWSAHLVTLNSLALSASHTRGLITKVIKCIIFYYY